MRPASGIPSVAAIAAAQADWQSVKNTRRAASAAKQALTGAAEALDAIRTNLRALGYPRSALTQRRLRDVEARIAELEEHTQLAVPQAIGAFWSIVGKISFVDLEGYEHVRFWRESGFGGSVCDGLHVDGCDRAWVEYMRSEHDESAERGDDQPFVWEFAPDALHKDNVSGGAPYGVVPGRGWAPVVTGLDWGKKRKPRTLPAGDVDFISYLRTCVLEGAGFPGLIPESGFASLRERLLQRVPLF